MLLALCVAAILRQHQPLPDSVYSSGYVRDLVAQAARSNLAVPATLQGYDALAEVEVAAIRRDERADHTIRIEQLAVATRWTRTGEYTQHVVGHRVTSSGFPVFDALRLSTFTVPVLYGNRFDLLLGPFDTVRTADGTLTHTTDEVFPLSADRDRIYRFEGGETVQRLTVNGRVVPVVRVRAIPVRSPRARTTVFRGDLYLDSLRLVLVGLRGEVLETGGRPSLGARATAFVARTVGYLQIMCTEVGGRYWVPAHQQMDVRISSGLVGSESLVIRVAADLHDVSLREASPSLTEAVSGPMAFPRSLTVAPSESASAFSGWRHDLGDLTSRSAFAPFLGSVRDDSIHLTTPGLALAVPSTRDLLHFNRIEGVYTGLGALLSSGAPANMRSGLTAGYAWSEHQFRGQFTLERRGRIAAAGVRVARELAITNDFGPSDDRGSALIALFGRDDYDYVDRRAAVAYGLLRFAGGETTLAGEAGVVRDAAVVATRERGLLHPSAVFRANRPVSPGSWFTSGIRLDVHPGVTADYVRPGSGFSLGVEHGSGRSTFTRVTARVTARYDLAPLTVAAQGDAGEIDAGAAYPLQRLFEIGGPLQLPDVGYKRLAGNRAVLGQLTIMLRPPLVALTNLPGAPRLAASLSAGYVDATDARAVDAVREIGSALSGCAGTTACAFNRGYAVSSLLGIRLLDGGVFVGLARCVSARDRWKPAISVGRAF